MAAAVARGGGAAVRRSSFLTGCNFLICENPCIRTPVLWKQPPSRTFFSDRRKLHTAPVRQAFRLRPFHVLVATGGGYAGYKKYEGYKLEQLEKKGVELPVKLASEWENFIRRENVKLIVDRPYHNAEMRSAGREAQARSAGREAQAKQRRQRSASEAAQAKKRASGDLAGSYISSLTAKPPGET